MKKRIISMLMVFCLMVALAPSAFAYGTVRNGSTGNDVKTLQVMLNTVQNAGLATDGIFGAKTKEAVLTFQRNNGLSADGICGPKTWAALTAQYEQATNPAPTPEPAPEPAPEPTPAPESAPAPAETSSAYPTLRNGSKGGEVQTLQTMLNQVLGAGLVVDGIYGTKTVQAVKNFQIISGLAVDGICGPKTWAALTAQYEAALAAQVSTPEPAPAPEPEAAPDVDPAPAPEVVPEPAPAPETTPAPAESSGSYPTLRSGSKGSEVQALQTMLNQLLGANLTVDGIYGAKTAQAVKNFQSINGLAVDGICGPKTWAALTAQYEAVFAAQVSTPEPAPAPEPEAVPDTAPAPQPAMTPAEAAAYLPVLRSGSKGTEVQILQALLNQLSGANLTEDGIYGAKTVQAVKNFQARNGLTADGVCGPKTWEVLLGGRQRSGCPVWLCDQWCYRYGELRYQQEQLRRLCIRDPQPVPHLSPRRYDHDLQQSL